MSLHTAYQETVVLRDLLRAWDAGTESESGLAQHRWTNLAIWPAARSATVAGSTGIEGNPLSVGEVDIVLAGGRVPRSQSDIRDVLNYNSALDLANRAALRPEFEWTQELLRRINAAILAGLQDDERGEYRREPLIVGDIFEPPEHQQVPALMAELVEWLRSSGEIHPLVRAGLTHLNVVSIHPWLNGNGRTARVAGSLSLMRSGIGAPELVNIEAYIRAHPDEYVAALQETHGPTYRPDEHSATPWLEYFARLSVDRLDLRNRIVAAIPNDLGLLVAELDRRHEPLDWAPILLAARVAPMRTTAVAASLGLSGARVRSILGIATRHGWLRAVGDRRGRRYVAAEELESLPLRVPELTDRLRSGSPAD